MYISAKSDLKGPYQCFFYEFSFLTSIKLYFLRNYCSPVVIFYTAEGIFLFSGCHLFPFISVQLKNHQIVTSVCSGECKAVGMRISTSKSEAMVLWKMLDCPLLIGRESLHQANWFKYLGDFKSRWTTSLVQRNVDVSTTGPLCWSTSWAKNARIR